MSENEQEPVEPAEAETPETYIPLEEPEEQEEAESGDETQPDAGESGDEPAAQIAPQGDAPAPTGMSQQEFERIVAASEKSWNTFSRNMRERWGPENENLAECPLCLTQHKGFVDLRHAGQYPPEIVKTIMGFLGLQVEQNYKQSLAHGECTFCDGKGKVSTGSTVPEFQNVTCPECHGFGYMPPPGGAGEVAPTNGGDPAHAAPPAEDFAHGDYDEFDEPKMLPDGRPNPNYGKRPAYKVGVEPWGVTAGLGKQSEPAPAAS